MTRRLMSGSPRRRGGWGFGEEIHEPVEHFAGDGPALGFESGLADAVDHVGSLAQWARNAGSSPGGPAGRNPAGWLRRRWRAGSGEDGTLITEIAGETIRANSLVFPG